MKKPWTYPEQRELMLLWPCKSARELALSFGRSKSAVQQKAASLGLVRTARQRSRIWSESTKRVPRGCVKAQMVQA